MKARSAQRTDEEIIDALRQARGFVTVAARRLGIHRSTIYRRIEKSPAVADVIEDERSFTGDVAEVKLIQAIEAGEPWAIKYYLDTLGVARGYGRRQHIDHEVSGKDGTPILTVVTLGDGEAGEA